MGEFRLYFLDAESHIIARLEFEAPDEALALRIAAQLSDACADMHRGFCLWRGRRQVFASDEGGGGLFMHPRGSKAISPAGEIVLSLEEVLLESHWCIARSQRLLEATSHLREDLKLAS